MNLRIISKLMTIPKFQEIFVPKNNHYRRWSNNVRLSSCFICLESATLLILNQQQIYLFGQIQTGGQPYLRSYFPLHSKWVISVRSLFLCALSLCDWVRERERERERERDFVGNKKVLTGKLVWSAESKRKEILQMWNWKAKFLSKFSAKCWKEREKKSFIISFVRVKLNLDAL